MLGAKNTLYLQHILEEALCFGWIDGQMQSIKERDLMTEFGRRKIEEDIFYEKESNI